MTDDSKDLIAALRAQTDQFNAATDEVAHALWMFYRALVGQGFSRDEAYGLVRDWLHMNFHDIGSGDGN